MAKERERKSKVFIMAQRQHLGFDPSANEISCKTAARFPRGNQFL